MTTPERTVEKIVKEFRNVGAILVDVRQTDIGEMTTWQGRASDVQIDWLTKTLQAERQRCEEMIIQ